MKRKHKRDNLERLFGVKNVPCTEQIKNIVDGVEPAGLESVFTGSMKLAEAEGIIEPYRVLDGGVLLAIDGTWYFSSEEIHCTHCLSIRKEGKGGKRTT
jgi:hypothetical protein